MEHAQRTTIHTRLRALLPVPKDTFFMAALCEHVNKTELGQDLTRLVYVSFTEDKTVFLARCINFIPWTAMTWSTKGGTEPRRDCYLLKR